MDFSPNYEAVFREIEQLKICLDKALLYESYALFLEAKGMMKEAHLVYQSGISRSLQSSPLYIISMSNLMTKGL